MLGIPVGGQANQQAMAAAADHNTAMALVRHVFSGPASDVVEVMYDYEEAAVRLSVWSSTPGVVRSKIAAYVGGGVFVVHLSPLQAFGAVITVNDNNEEYVTITDDGGRVFRGGEINEVPDDVPPDSEGSWIFRERPAFYRFLNSMLAIASGPRRPTPPGYE